MVQFTNPDVAAKYESGRAVDTKVHVPAGKTVPGGEKPIGYSGMLSGITLAAADKMYASGSNNLKLKPVGNASAKNKAEDKAANPV